MITTETCKMCKGIGIVERLEERDGNGHWHHNTMLPHHIADNWLIADRQAPVRLVDVTCPCCHGDKTVEIEHVTCKIF